MIFILRKSEVPEHPSQRLKAVKLTTFQIDFDTVCNRDLDLMKQVGLGQTLKRNITLSA